MNRSGFEAGGEQIREQILHPLRADRVGQAVGHRGNGRGLHLFDVGTRDDRFVAFRIANAKRIALGSHRSGERAAVLESQVERDEVGIDREAGLADVAQNRGVIAMRQVRQIGADFSAFAAIGVARRTLRNGAVENLAAAGPIAAGEFGRERQGLPRTRRRSRFRPKEASIDEEAARGADCPRRRPETWSHGLSPPVVHVRRNGTHRVRGYRNPNNRFAGPSSSDSRAGQDLQFEVARRFEPHDRVLRRAIRHPRASPVERLGEAGRAC